MIYRLLSGNENGSFNSFINYNLDVGINWENSIKFSDRFLIRKVF